MAAKKRYRRTYHTGTVICKRDHKRRKPYFAVVRIRDANGNSRRKSSKGFEYKDEAERARQKMLDDNGLGDPNDATVAFIVPAFVDAREAAGKHSPTTTQRYRSLYKNNLAELADVKVAALDDAVLASHYARLRKQGLSATTIFHADALLRSACTWAKRTKRIPTSPFDIHQPEKPIRSRNTFRALTVDDVQNFLAHIDPNEQGDNAVLFAFATAMRRGEIIGLRKDALDLKRNVVTVRESRYKITGEQKQKGTKTGEPRDVPLNALAFEALDHEEKRQRDLRKVAGEVWEDSGFVFCNAWGAPLPVDSIYTSFRLIAERAKITGYTLHSLRHTVATLMLADGVDIQSIKAILGHSRASTTLDIYTHAIPGRKAEAMRVVDRYARARKPPARRKAARR